MNRIFIALGKLSRIFYYLQHPQENPRIAAVALGIIVVVGLLIAGFLALVYLKIATPEKKDAESRKKKEKKYAILVLILFALGLLLATYESRKPAFCGSCHVNQTIVRSWGRSSHNEVSCYKCHQSPGFLGYIEFMSRGSANLFSYYKQGWDIPVRGFVDDQSCLSCHINVKNNNVIARGVRVSHKEIIEGGQGCSACHSGVGHASASLTNKKPTMEQCINCHNGKKASAKCSSCHTTDMAKTAKKFGENYANANLPELTSCRGCHKPKTERNCIACMGFEMPHPEGWAPIKDAPPQFQIKPKHPSFGFKYFEKCMNCHNTDLCNECHQFKQNERNHGTRWLQEHKKFPKKPSCGCHRPVPSDDWCKFCHGSKFQRSDPGSLKYYNQPAVK